MAAPKLEEISHPPMDQLQGLEYCIDSNPSWGEAIALGFQHYILALGTAVMIPSFLVPLMGGSDGDKVRVVQTLLFVEGINTLLQTLFGTRLPTVVGGSYAFMVPIISIIHDPSLASIEDNHVVGRCVEIGIPMLILFIAFSQYLKNFKTRHLPIMERFALLITITVIWAYAHLLTASGAYKHRPDLTQMNCRTDKANLISSAPWIKIPYPLQWGAPTFDAGHAFGMMAAVLVSLIESTGAYKAASRLASATPPPAHVLSRGIGWQGIGILLSGLFGTLSGSSVSVENVGLLGSTRVGSRRVIQISAGFMIFFSMLGKFGAFFASIPFTIFAAVYCVLFGLVGRFQDLHIDTFALFLGLSVPEYFREYTAKALHGPAHTRAGWFNDFLNTIFFSSPTVALIVAVFLDNTLDYKDSAKDRGMPWWVKFRTFKGDTRNEEFYTLPFNLNRFFPPS
ncbi:nucleobase-ascorbate transporter 2 [Citrus sinensis]|uniref:Nucleobase-ascorbate transporter 2 n=1 Tax=Citrus sinensis TaxID=2711 RepID=A0ACB8NHM8_CITSI|nr:nucleobase-ascorbate transporter 2 [Citrus sinensis]